MNFTRWHLSSWRSLAFCLTVTSMTLGVSATGGALAAVGVCSPAGNPAPSPIAPGQTTSFTVFFYCLGPGIGNFLSDNITVEIPKPPEGVTFSPKSTVADTGNSNGTTITITTTKTTPAGTVNLEVSGKGKTCPSYTPPCQEQFVIKPEIMCTPSATNVCNVWWFNGESPQPKGYVTTLTASSGGSDYTWTITGGTSYAQFSNNSSTIDTKSKDTVVLMPKNDPGAASPTVSVTVKVKSKTGGTATSDPFNLSVRKPYELQPNGISDAADKNYGYVSYIHYRILDQTMAVLPATISLNEHFTSGLTNNYPGANWRFPDDCGSKHVCTGAFDPNDFYDQVQGESQAVAKGVLAVPVPQNPQAPLGATAVDHWSGTWSIGDDHPGRGVQVQSDNWQKYRDHARHTNIVSPSP